MGDFNLMEEMQNLVERGGDAIGLHTGDCILWKFSHPNCIGCKYELSCDKLVRIMRIIMIPLVYEPKGYKDFTKMNNRIQELLQKTLKAKSLEELHKIPTQ